MTAENRRGLKFLGCSAAILLLAIMAARLTNTTSAPVLPETRARTPAPTPTVRAEYRRGLQRTMHAQGIDSDILSWEEGPAVDVDILNRQIWCIGFFPCLVFWGSMSKPIVYQMAYGANIIGTAKDLEFKVVAFKSKRDYGDGGKWIFDLSRDNAPRCDTRAEVCQ